MKKDCSVTGCPLNGKFDHNHQPRAFVESEAEGAHVVVLAPFEAAEIDPKELVVALDDAIVSYDLHIEKIDQGGSIVKSAIRTMKARARLIRRAIEQLRAAPTIDQLHNAILGVAEESQRAYVEGERKITAPGCECASIMQADVTRHFRGCPLREKYPTHEAERCQSRDAVLDPERRCILKEGHAGIHQLPPIAFISEGNAWASKEAAPPGAVEHKFEASEPTVFDHDLEKHRKKVWARLEGGLEDFNFQIADAIFFLLTVAHQPLPVDVVPVDAVRERFDALETVVKREESNASKNFSLYYERFRDLLGRIEKLEKEQATFLFPFRDAVPPPGWRDEWPVHKQHATEAEAVRERGHSAPIPGTVFHMRARALLNDLVGLERFGEAAITRVIEDFRKARGEAFQQAARTAIPFQHDRPKIVVLCGSTRFSKAFASANLAETLKGNIILTVGNMMHASDADTEVCVRCRATDRSTPCVKGYSMHQFERLTSTWHKDTKKALDALHFKKIEVADEVLVLNVFRCARCGEDEHGGNQFEPSKIAAGSCYDGHAMESYIGESTRNEIQYALTLKKRIRFLNMQGPGKFWSLKPGDVPSVDEVMKQMGLA